MPRKSTYSFQSEIEMTEFLKNFQEEPAIFELELDNTEVPSTSPLLRSPGSRNLNLVINKTNKIKEKSISSKSKENNLNLPFTTLTDIVVLDDAKADRNNCIGTASAPTTPSASPKLNRYQHKSYDPPL